MVIFNSYVKLPEGTGNSSVIFPYRVTFAKERFAKKPRAPLSVLPGTDQYNQVGPMFSWRWRCPLQVVRPQATIAFSWFTKTQISRTGL